MAKLDGAIKFLLQTIADQLNFSNDPKNMLLQNLETYLPDIYQYSELIMNGVIKPIAYSVLGFLLLLEFQQMAQKIMEIIPVLVAWSCSSRSFLN